MSLPLPLYACLHMREFSAQAMLRLRQELRTQPVAILAGEPPQERVCSVNSLARKLGIQHGMTRLECESFPQVVMLRRSLAELGLL